MTAPQIKVSALEIRRRFNDGRYFERMMDGADESVHLGEIRDVGPAPPRYPRGTRSQIVVYLDRWNKTIVIAHQYGRPDGEPTEGTLPDPKFLFEDGIRYKYSPSPREASR